VIQVIVNYQGHVQGVGFRATAQSIARRFPVTGWVRNEADDSVTLVAEGAETDIDAFLAAIRTRMASNISREERNTAPATRSFQEFEIRR